jgi:hypothetical protein
MQIKGNKTIYRMAVLVLIAFGTLAHITLVSDVYIRAVTSAYKAFMAILR